MSPRQYTRHLPPKGTSEEPSMQPAAILLLFGRCVLPAASFVSSGELSHADPVVPILIASIFITLGAALGGLLMKCLKHLFLMGALLVVPLWSNLGYYSSTPTLPVLGEANTLTQIS